MGSASGVASTSTATWLLTAAAPATEACSNLAMTRVSASRSPNSGISASIRRATSSALASSTPSRSGRAMVSALSMTISPPSHDTSIRSPGVWPGSPHIHTSCRSSMSCFSLSPKIFATSGTWAPGCDIR